MQDNDQYIESPSFGNQSLLEIKNEVREFNLQNSNTLNESLMIGQTQKILSLHSYKDLSFALFMGISLDTKYKNIQVANRNKKIIQFFSRQISHINRETFRQKIQKLQAEYRALIKETKDGDEPYVDSFGRVTFFYLFIGNIVFPIYQPGTVMLETAVKKNSEIAINSEDGQRNGEILSNQSALFLVRFVCKLAIKYNLLMKESQQQTDSLNQQILKSAIENNLQEFCVEDMKGHGCLLILKEKLVGLVQQECKLDIKSLTLFQLKDYFKSQDDEKVAEVCKDIQNLKINSQDAIKVMDIHQKYMIFPRAKLQQLGGDIIDNDIEKMKTQILKQTDLVPAQTQEVFKIFVCQCMNRMILDQIGGQFNSFSRESFRLNALNRSQKILKLEQVETDSVKQQQDSQNQYQQTFSQLVATSEQNVKESYSAQIRSVEDSSQSSCPFNQNLMDTKFQQAMLEGMEQSGFEHDNYMNDNELYYMQHLNKNEGLLEYYHMLQEGLCSIFTQSKIINGNFKIQTQDSCSTVLRLAGEAIPQVGNALKGLANIIEWKNEKEIIQRLTKISNLIRDDQKNLIAKYISSKLVIKRRFYLQKLTREQIKESVSSFEKLQLLFDDSNVFKLKAQMDLKMIEIYILSQPLNEINEIYTFENFAEIFSNKIVQQFIGNQILNTLSPQLKEKEQPEVHMIERKFMMVDEYFTNDKYKLPIILKKIPNESEIQHQERVNKFLIACDSKTFTEIGFLINPQNPFQQGFFDMYNEATNLRLKMKNNGDEINVVKQSKCFLQ